MNVKKRPEDYGITKYSWNNGLLDVHQSVRIHGWVFENNRLPFNFGIVKGDFHCYGNSMTSLEGCPRVVGGSFKCNDNYLTSLEGGPQFVGGSYFCSRNLLTSLKGSPEKINGTFDCGYNELSSLEFSPKYVGSGFYCHSNLLSNLKGGPITIKGSIDCRGNSQLKLSINDAPDVIGHCFIFDLAQTATSLEDLLTFTIKFDKFYQEVDIVENPDKQTTINNLKKKIAIMSKVSGK